MKGRKAFRIATPLLLAADSSDGAASRRLRKLACSGCAMKRSLARRVLTQCRGDQAGESLLRHLEPPPANG